MIKDEVVRQDLGFNKGNVGVRNVDDNSDATAAGGGREVGNPNCFDPMEEDDDQTAADVMDATGERDLWLDDREQANLLDVNDSAMFYNDFPPLPDFPCMSSSSSSSSAPAASRTGIASANSTSTSSAATSSPAASWAVMKSDNEEDMSFQGLNNGDSNGKDNSSKPEDAATALSSTASMELPTPSDLGDVDCIDVMENFSYMDLIDTTDIWDPSTVFQSESLHEFPEDHENHHPAQLDQKVDGCDEAENGLSFLQGNSELAMIFLEWLKQNKDYISAEDMRNIKLKRSTIESASKRLGTTKEGKKQLLKLILEWVGQYQLQKKRMRESGPPGPYPYQETVPNPDPNPNPKFTSNLMTYNPIPPNHANACFASPPWMPPPPPPHVAAAATPHYCYGGGPYSNPMAVPFAPMNQQVVNGIPYTVEYPVMEHAQSWPPAAMVPYPIPQPPTPQFSPFPDNGNIMTHQQTVYGNPYQVLGPNGERLMRMGSSATKEARKKRMARQRRLYTHHHRHNSSLNQHQNQMNDPNLLNVGEDCDPVNWLCCLHNDSSPGHGNAPPPDQGSEDRAQLQNNQRQSTSDRRQQQGWKTEKNLKFLLQKVLKQSDVGNLGRIVLPKKEAESHLPELETRDGIPIAMEDIGTSRIWNMRYRYWPNNKSRMYLLENTGDFVRVNGLQEGDFIVIYSDTKCGKYMIRGVKVRQPGTKPEGKKPVRRNMRNLSITGNNSSLIKQAAVR